jgi:hypothetical protein
MNDDASKRAGIRASAWPQALAILALLPWLGTRLGWFDAGTPAVNGLVLEGRLWPLFFIDHNAVWLLLAGALWLICEPTRRTAWAIGGMLALAHAWVYATESLVRYYAGGASAYGIVIDTSCRAHGECIARQIESAKQQGFREGVRGPRLRVSVKRWRVAATERCGIQPSTERIQG